MRSDRLGYVCHALRGGGRERDDHEYGGRPAAAHDQGQSGEQREHDPEGGGPGAAGRVKVVTAVDRDPSASLNASAVSTTALGALRLAIVSKKVMDRR
ncbi:hypothetical protein ACFVTC_36935 [Streptomyces sp. NPDC057950]|uniref:hypothetical protein n=1 Tax=Streptomyces sp. NPDC057950 TaxID=3346288 RepID=UPI0036E11A69